MEISSISAKNSWKIEIFRYCAISHENMSLSQIFCKWLQISNFFKESHKSKHCKISFSNNIWFLNYVKLKFSWFLNIICCRRRMKKPMYTIFVLQKYSTTSLLMPFFLKFFKNFLFISWRIIGAGVIKIK